MEAASYFAGIDAGSTASKCVIVDGDGSLAARGLYAAGAGTAGPRTAFDKARASFGLEEKDIVLTCSTGYGRHLLAWADMQMSELSCHARGAAFLLPSARTVVDIGGQDAKVLRIGEGGRLESFVMNDKCAAGTGRFLDVMASIFGCRASDLSAYDAQAKKVLAISSTCTVFAESEVVSKLAAGEAVADVVAGIHASVVERTYALLRRAGARPAIAMTGGVALNEALRSRLEEKIGQRILTCELAQYNGALGAALYAREAHLGSAVGSGPRR